MRSKKNSRDNSTTDLALKETISKLNKNYDNIVILQVTSPLRKVNTIKKFVRYCIKNKLNNCLTVSKQNDNISYFDKKYFSPLNKVRKLSQNRKPFLYENGLIYFISRKAFANNFRIYPKKNWNYYLTNKYESLDINDFEDLNICKILMKKMSVKFKISKKVISENCKPYIIAEACINHEGNVKIAKKMIDKAVEAGVSAVKFQFHVLEDEMLKYTPKSNNFSESLYDTLKGQIFQLKNINI